MRVFFFFFLREKEMRELRENFLKIICKNYVVLEDLMASCQWYGRMITIDNKYIIYGQK